MINITKDSKVRIWTSGANITSGGIEVMYKLGEYLYSRGVDVAMFAYGDNLRDTGSFFADKYNVPLCNRSDFSTLDPNVIIVLTEYMMASEENYLWFCKEYKCQLVIWFVSSAPKTAGTSEHWEDLFDGRYDAMSLWFQQCMSRTIFCYENELARKRLEFWNIKDIMPLSHGVTPMMYDKSKELRNVDKEDIIIYNQRKHDNRKYLEKEVFPVLREMRPDIKIVGIGIDKRYTKDELCELYSRAKVYIDMTDFVGREMMPREATLFNNIILLHNFNNAASFAQYPIPSEYKLNLWDVKNVCNMLCKCIDEYYDRIKDMSFMKNLFLNEDRLFKIQADNIFGLSYKN